MTIKKIVINIMLLTGYVSSSTGACPDNTVAIRLPAPNNQQPLEEAKLPALKRRKSDGAEQQTPSPLQQVYFNNQIQPVIQDLMVKEEGKLLAAMYMVESDTLLSWWAMRRYIQEFERARQANNIYAMMNADSFKTSAKEDVLIVDKPRQAADIGSKMFHLQKLAQSGIQVLIRTQDRACGNSMQVMHNKFMIFFHKNSGIGKIVITGSFNLTNQAANYNWENIVILNDPAVIAQFIAEYNNISTFCRPIQSISL